MAYLQRVQGGWEFDQLTAVSQSSVREGLKSLMIGADLNPRDFCFHSLKRGAATEARRGGLNTEDIRTLGRWKSIRMVQHYTKRSAEDITNLSKKLYATHDKV